VTSIRRLLLVAFLVLAAPVVLIACGGDDEDTGEDPQEVIDQTFNNDETVTSGTLSISLNGSAEGDQGGNFDATISGPFQGAENDPAALPQFDFTADITAEGAGQSFSFDGGLIVSEDNAFVEYGGETYEVGTDTFAQFKRAFERQSAQTQEQADEAQSVGDAFRSQCEAAVQQAGGGDASACDIDFSSWLTNLENEGTEDIEGTESVHIHGDLNVDQMLQDLAELGQATQGTGVTPVPDLESQIETLSGAVSEASFDLYSTEAEKLLNGLDFNLGIDPSAIPGAEEAGVDSVDVGFSVRLGAINEEQTIEAPTDAQPLDDLLNQFGIPGLEGLGGIPGVGGGEIPGGGGVPQAPGGGSVPGGDPYLDCIAQNPQNPEQCLDELQ
jgi:hypothetical protein